MSFFVFGIIPHCTYSEYNNDGKVSKVFLDSSGSFLGFGYRSSNPYLFKDPLSILKFFNRDSFIEYVIDPTHVACDLKVAYTIAKAKPSFLGLLTGSHRYEFKPEHLSKSATSEFHTARNVDGVYNNFLRVIPDLCKKILK